MMPASPSLTLTWLCTRVPGQAITTIQKFMPAEQGDRNAVLSDWRNRGQISRR
jgi:hypothetical protein